MAESVLDECCAAAYLDQVQVRRRSDAVPPSGQQREEVVLVDYLLVLWRRKALIGLGSLAVAVVALAVSFTLPKQYEASTTLMVIRSKFGSGQLLGAQQVALTAKTYEGIIKNGGALSEAMARFKLAEPPYGFHIRDLAARVGVTVVKDTSLVTVSVNLPDQQLVADVTNFLARRAIELNDRLNESEVSESRDFLDTQVEQASTRLEEAEQVLETFHRGANIEIVRKEVETRLIATADLETQRGNVVIALAQANGNMARLGDDLRQQPTTTRTSRSLIEDPAYQQALAKLSRVAADSLLGVNMQAEELNPTYSFIEAKLAESRRDASGLTARRNELDSLLEQTRQELHALQDELTQKTTTHERLTRTYELARDSYSTLRNRMEASHVEVVSKSTVLRVVDPALAPQRASRPRALLNTAVAGAVGLLGAVFVVFFVDYVQRAQRHTRG